MKKANYTIQGTQPLLMHSERLANPFDPLTREMKAIAGKRKKTEDDLSELARLEWEGGLYHDETIGIYVPAYNLLAAFVGGGKVQKLGSTVKRAALVLGDKIELQFDGPKEPKALFADEHKRFVDMRSVKVGTSKVMRCRPIFRKWKLTFVVGFDESSLQRHDLDRVVRDTGEMVGLGDYRPRFGRFEIVESA